MRKFRSDSDGDYRFRDDAKTFHEEFYYINYIDKYDKFNSEFSENLDDKKYDNLSNRLPPPIFP